MYYDLLDIIGSEISDQKFSWFAREIHKRERSFCYKDFHRSASFCARQLEKCGASQVEIIPLPSDGKTTYMDQIMPQAWDVTDARLEIVAPSDVPVKLLADRREEMFCVANRSAPTPKAGVVAEVVLEEDMRKGKNVKGKVIFNSHVSPSELIKEVIERGAIGVISDYSPNRAANKDSTFWINGWGEGPGWYQTRDERPLFYFSITSRKRTALRRLIKANRTVKIRAKVKSRIYDGSIDTVTGVIPGKRNEEILLLAHLYEPLANDNATGGAALIEIIRVLNSLINAGQVKRPERSIRVLMSLELYGSSAFFVDRKRRRRTLAAVNMDSFSINHKDAGCPLTLRMNPASQPFFGDVLLKSMTEHYFQKEAPDYPWQVSRGIFNDDTFIADPTINIPVNWFYQSEGKYWHNSLNTFQQTDWEASKRIMTIVATYAYLLASAGKKEILWLTDHVCREGKRIVLEEANDLASHLIGNQEEQPGAQQDVKGRLEFVSSWQRGRIDSIGKFWKRKDEIAEKLNACNREIDHLASNEIRRILTLQSRIAKRSEKETDTSILSRKETVARNMIPRRKTVGLPHCLARVPKEHRVKSPFAASEALAWTDGFRDLLEILQLVEYEVGRKLSQNEVGDLVRYFSLLDRYGYVRTRHRVELHKSNIKQALRKVGLNKKDVVFVHSSLSALGQIKGGADTVIDAFLEALGQRGTLLMTTHTADRTTLHDGVVRTNGAVEGYNPQRTPSGVGVISDTFWRRQGVLRSAHPTHSVAAFGPLAEEMLRGHTVTSNPCDCRSPFGKMLDHDGYLLFFGVEMTCATFFHTVEDRFNLPYLRCAKILVDDSGKDKVITMKRFPSGHRDFYHLPNKILTRLRKAKMGIKVAKVGAGELKMVRARELYEKTSTIVKREPDVLLCDNPECKFCSKWKANVRACHSGMSEKH